MCFLNIICDIVSFIDVFALFLFILLCHLCKYVVANKMIYIGSFLAFQKQKIKMLQALTS